MKNNISDDREILSQGKEEAKNVKKTKKKQIRKRRRLQSHQQLIDVEAIDSSCDGSHIVTNPAVRTTELLTATASARKRKNKAPMKKFS